MIRTFYLQKVLIKQIKEDQRYRHTILTEQLHISISEGFLEIEFQFVMISKPAVLPAI